MWIYIGELLISSTLSRTSAGLLIREEIIQEMLVSITNPDQRCQFSPFFFIQNVYQNFCIANLLLIFYLMTDIP